MFEITETKQYKKDEKKYSQIIGSRLIKMENELRENPLNGSDSIKKLTGFEPPYRYRIGQYRIFYDVIAKTVNLITIRPRGEAYKK